MLRVLTKRRVRRRLTTQVTRTSKVLPRKRARNVYPLQPGDDPDFKKPLLPRSSYPTRKYAEFLTEVYHVYWMLLHAVTFLVPVFRQSSHPLAAAALENIALFMEQLPESSIFGCQQCSLHFADFVTRAKHDLQKPRPLHWMVVVADDPYALAKWLVELHNDIHVGKVQQALLAGKPPPQRSPVPFERVRAVYETSVYPAAATIDHERLTVVEAFLRTQYSLKIRSDFVSDEIVRSGEKPLNKYYINAIGIKLKNVYPHGYYRHYWHRIRHIHNTGPLLAPDEFTGRLIAIMFMTIVAAQFTRNVRTHKSSRASSLRCAAGHVALSICFVAQQVVLARR